MINVSNIILQLQQEAQTTDNNLRLLMLSRSIELLRLGKVSVVEEFGDLPTTDVSTGELYLVESEDTLYFRKNGVWEEIYVPGPGLSWGNGASGQLGNGFLTQRQSPINIIGNITNWSQLSAGFQHSLGVTQDGIAYAWGSSGQGQLGDNTAVDRSSPVTVAGGITNWSQVSAGEEHSLGVTQNGVAYAWGNSSNGQLGTGDATPQSSPVTVAGGITNWSQVSAGVAHSLGVTNSGIAYAWGNSAFGALGDDANTARSSPVTVVGGITDWSQVSAGERHSLGITDSGIAYAWGYGNYGRLGDDTTVDRSSPVTVVGGITNWSQISASERHSLGVTQDGIAYAWGNGSFGRLGDNTITNKSSPVTVAGGITNWSQLSAGRRHSLGVTQDGVAYAWGNGLSGRLGDGTEVAKSSPVTVAGGLATWSQVSAGNSHSLGLTQ